MTLTWRTGAAELSNLINARGIVLAGVRGAFIDVGLASISFETGQALALESATVASTFAAIHAGG